MKISEFLGEIHQRDSLLFRGGLFTLIVAPLLLIPFFFDDRLVLGINPWIKPIKFCLSITIFVWTVAWMLNYLPDIKRWRKVISTSIFLSMIIEILVILVQAARGTSSHFNTSTSLDGILFGIMGVMITVSTVAIVGLFLLFLFYKPALDKVYYYSILLGIATFLLASYMGGIMITNMSHSIGVPDGGPGLPFLNWSTEGGDLRAAHFFGLHAFQIFPLFAHFMQKSTTVSYTGRLISLFFFILSYLAILGYVFFQAMNGVPLIG